MIIVVSGVAGSGKTTVGRALAAALGWEFLDADAFHSPENLARMHRGLPLDEAARAPWLSALRTAISQRISAGTGLVLACSALRRAHREALTVDAAQERFVRLVVPESELKRRLETRPGHFFPASLLESQLDADEPGDDLLRVDGAAPVDTIVAEIRRIVRA